MKPETEKMIAYFRDMPSNGDKEDLDAVLNWIWYCHTQCLTNDKESFEDLVEPLRPIIKTLSKKRQSVLFRKIALLCEKCERVAFLEGIRVGAQLILELTK